MNTWKTPSEKFKQKFAALISRFHSIQKTDGEELRFLQERLRQLQNTPFGRYLIENGGVDGRWVNHCFDRANAFWFNEVPSLAAMRLRHESCRTALQRHLFSNMTVGVLPGKYETEWTCLQEEWGAALVCVDDKDEFFRNTGHFDLIIQNSFLYGEDQNNQEECEHLFAGLKSGGILLISAWVPPEIVGSSAGLHSSQSHFDDLFFEHLLQMKKSSFCSIQVLKSSLRLAGFDRIESLGGENCGLQTLLAKKPSFGSTLLKHKRAVTHMPRRTGKRGAYTKGMY